MNTSQRKQFCFLCITQPIIFSDTESCEHLLAMDPGNCWRKDPRQGWTYQQPSNKSTQWRKVKEEPAVQGVDGHRPGQMFQVREGRMRNDVPKEAAGRRVAVPVVELGTGRHSTARISRTVACVTSWVKHAIVSDLVAQITMRMWETLLRAEKHPGQSLEEIRGSLPPYVSEGCFSSSNPCIFGLTSSL